MQGGGVTPDSGPTPEGADSETHTAGSGPEYLNILIVVITVAVALVKMAEHGQTEPSSVLFVPILQSRSHRL